METDDIPDFDADNSSNYDPSTDEGACYNTDKYSDFIREIMGCGLSYREGARVGNGLMRDLIRLGKLQEDDALWITKSKVEREMDRIGKIDAAEHDESVTGIVAIGFDGKASKCLQSHCQTTVENKVSIIDMMSRGYVDHVIPEDGTGEELSNSLIEVRHVALLCICNSL